MVIVHMQKGVPRGCNHLWYFVTSVQVE